MNATDASLLDEAASGQTVAQIPSIPNGVSLTFGGPDPYLYLSAVQGAPGQTVTETLYLDVTNPNGIQLTALDEAIGFDASALQISDVRGTSALAALGSYETASTVDNGSGEFLVGQAFMGTGLPPVVPYGTVIPVLQFDVTLNSDMTVGSQTGLTLMQYGTVNGITQWTAVSDNEGALTFTPGMVPSNSGNAAIDGTVNVVAQTAPAEVEASAPQSQRPVVVLPTVVVPVPRVTPAIRPVAQVVAVPANVVTTMISTTTASVEVATVSMETIISTVSPLMTSATEVVGTSATVTIAPTVVLETVPTMASSATRVTDPGAALSLAAVGTNRAMPVALATMSSGKTTTSVLDEMYRELGTMSGVSAGNAYYNGNAGDDSLEALPDVWDLEYNLFDMDFTEKSADQDPQ